MRVRIRLEVVKNTNSYREDVIIYMGGNMKKDRIKIISILAVLCILVHTKPVYAEEMGDITDRFDKVFAAKRLALTTNSRKTRRSRFVRDGRQRKFVLMRRNNRTRRRRSL